MYFLEEPEAIHHILKLESVLAEIRAGYLPHVSLYRYHYISSLGFRVKVLYPKYRSSGFLRDVRTYLPGHKTTATPQS